LQYNNVLQVEDYSYSYALICTRLELYIYVSEDTASMHFSVDMHSH